MSRPVVASDSIGRCRQTGEGSCNHKKPLCLVESLLHQRGNCSIELVGESGFGRGSVVVLSSRSKT